MAKNTSKYKYVSVSLTGEGIMNYAALPPELDQWRRYRIEYGGHAMSCFMEQTIYLPPYADAFILDLLFDFWQTTGKEREKIKQEIIKEL